MFRCNQPPAFLAERPRSVMRYCGNTQLEGIHQQQQQNQHRKFAVEKKILQLLPPGIEPSTFRSRVRHSTNWAIPPASGLFYDVCRVHVSEAYGRQILNLTVIYRLSTSHASVPILYLFSKFDRPAIALSPEWGRKACRTCVSALLSGTNVNDLCAVGNRRRGSFSSTTLAGLIDHLHCRQ